MLRYCLETDNDSHWYVIPQDRQQDWENWCELDDERGWEVPVWAFAVDSPCAVTFAYVEVDGVPYVA